MNASALARLRTLFPVVERYAYLNHAAIGPCPARAIEATAAVVRQVAESGELGWPERNRRVETVRAQVAASIGAARTDEVAFVANTADGLSLIAAGLSWKAGDNIVSAELEYPSNVYPWTMLADLGVSVRRVPERDGRLEEEELLALIDERTRVLALSWVQFASGYRCDLARLGRACRERGVLFVVDIIQAWGALALDVEASSIDICCAATHKWVLGPEGLGILYVSDRVLESIRPWRAGWRSVRDIFEWGKPELEWAAGARRFECGTLNKASIAALGESLTLLYDEIGITEVEHRVLAHADAIRQGLTERGFDVLGGRPGQRPGKGSGIVAATHPRLSSRTLTAALAEKNVIVAERVGRLRVSPHVYNDEEDLGRFFAAVDGLM